MKLFKGSGVAIVTPFKEGNVDYEKLTELIKWHIEEGTDAIVVAGTTGESATLSKAEKLELFRHSMKVSEGKIQIIAGTGSNNTQESISLSVEAEKIGVQGLLLVTPYYNKPSQRGLYAHYKTIAEAVSIPIILYNVPGRTSVDLKPETVIELSKIHNILGLKEASGDVARIRPLAEALPADFMIYAGNDGEIVDVLESGGHGVISVLANIVPKEVHQITEDYFSGNLEAARRSQDSYQKLIDALFSDTNPVPVKAAMNYMGMEVGGLRLPLVEMDDENHQKLKTVLMEYGLLEDVN
ncbi:MAG: 4-hydroxy-tetrahydrodipicolinate synthase [Clostridiaceae bacterium]